MRTTEDDYELAEPQPGRLLVPGEPDPWKASTAAQYVRQLRALRAWAGQPGHKESHKEIGRLNGRRMPSSTLYDALSGARTQLPPLGVVRDIVRACSSPDAYQDWIDAWRALRLRQFEQGNPDPEEGSPVADALTSTIQGWGEVSY